MHVDPSHFSAVSTISHEFFDVFNPADSAVRSAHPQQQQGYLLTMGTVFPRVLPPNKHVASAALHGRKRLIEFDSHLELGERFQQTA